VAAAAEQVFVRDRGGRRRVRQREGDRSSSGLEVEGGHNEKGILSFVRVGGEPRHFGHDDEVLRRWRREHGQLPSFSGLGARLVSCRAFWAWAEK
jgi:hypothetical protein